MTEATKVTNYTAEQTAYVIEAYQAGQTVEAIASELGRNVKSVIAKLAKEKVYVSKAKAPAKREMLKKDMVAEIATFLGKDEEQLESLEKATGPALMAVLLGLRGSEAT